MKPFTKKTRLILSAITLGGAAMVGVLEFSQVQRLEAVTVDGQRVPDPQKTLGLDPGASVLKQPLNIAARYLLLDDQTVKVDVDYVLPASLAIRTNRFVPACLMLDRTSGTVLGLDDQGRVVPLADDFSDWQKPLITGVAANRVLQKCDDPRVPVIVAQLGALCEENKELYRLVDEVDLSDQKFALLIFSGLPYALRVSAHGLFEQLTSFFRVVETYQTKIDSAGTVDLRFAGLIVQEAKVVADSTKKRHKDQKEREDHKD